MDRDEVAKLSHDLEIFMIMNLAKACHVVGKDVFPPDQDAMKEVSQATFAKFATPENALALVHVLGPEAIRRWYLEQADEDVRIARNEPPPSEPPPSEAANKTVDEFWLERSDPRHPRHTVRRIPSALRALRLLYMHADETGLGRIETVRILSDAKWLGAMGFENVYEFYDAFNHLEAAGIARFTRMETGHLCPNPRFQLAYPNRRGEEWSRV